MKKISIALMTCIGTLLFGQMGIGTANPQAGSMLDLSSRDKGFLPPRLTTQQRDGINPKPAGLWIYNTDENCMQYWNDTSWVGNCSGSMKKANENDEKNSHEILNENTIAK